MFARNTLVGLLSSIVVFQVSLLLSVLMLLVISSVALFYFPHNAAHILSWIGY